jgi:hypothetical protein
VSWRREIAVAVQADADARMDACTVAISAQFDLPADEVREQLAAIVQPAVDEIIAELMAGETATQTT